MRLYSVIKMSLLPNQIIKNIHLPNCNQCIYYEPVSDKFESTLNKCKKFGTKDIVNKIDYEYIDICRKNESMCGMEGKYFIHNEYYELDKITHFIKTNYLCGIIILSVLTNVGIVILKYL